jgi:hypothetical protein
VLDYLPKRSLQFANHKHQLEFLHWQDAHEFDHR